MKAEKTLKKTTQNSSSSGHWCIMIINFAKDKIEILDSLGPDNDYIDCDVLFDFGKKMTRV